ncbi:hypothetical protein Scep_010488 [Stephania cephalantha]|uniref:Uncharacterized protein n=1 Tax=Stephania cephalantha TaxID=152367 RepID=A0AAP0JXL4_9MAGN
MFHCRITTASASAPPSLVRRCPEHHPPPPPHHRYRCAIGQADPCRHRTPDPWQSLAVAPLLLLLASCCRFMHAAASHSAAPRRANTTLRIRPFRHRAAAIATDVADIGNRDPPSPPHESHPPLHNHAFFPHAPSIHCACALVAIHPASDLFNLLTSGCVSHNNPICHLVVRDTTMLFRLVVLSTSLSAIRR